MSKSQLYFALVENIWHLGERRMRKSDHFAFVISDGHTQIYIFMFVRRFDGLFGRFTDPFVDYLTNEKMKITWIY